MRIVVIVSEAQPELLKELNAIPVRFRADRIRTLAALGLLASRGCLTLPTTPQPTFTRSGGETLNRSCSPQVAKVRDQLRKNLMG
jgi:hypothetical protein